MADLTLVRPRIELVNSYVAALRRGWEFAVPSAREHLEAIEADPERTLEGFEDRLAQGPPIVLPNGEHVPRLPGFQRWLSDGQYAGSFSVRWAPGTHDLPEYVLGHVGYAIIPERRRRGYATRGLALLLEELTEDEDVALDYVELTTNVDNVASQKVILANAGELVEEFVKTERQGGGSGLRYRIRLNRSRSRRAPKIDPRSRESET